MPPYYPVDQASGRIPLEIYRKEPQLSVAERQYLLAVEKGDLPTVRHFLDEAAIYFNININCVDSLGRSSLLIAIQNENIEIIELLLTHNVQIGDALLHAIDEEVLEAVDLILKHKPTGKKDVRAQILHDQNETDFTPDITPVMLAAHKNNYEILRLLIERGASIPEPHAVKCGCNDCKSSMKHDGLRHSRRRLNIYKALTSPSLIVLTCEDPILTAFELSSELRRLATLENEFKGDYEGLVEMCKTFSEDLLDQTRGSKELEVILNRDETSPTGNEPLSRLKLAVRHRQKAFVAHPNCQQLLAELWYQGLPGWRRYHTFLKALIIICIAMTFPVLSVCYLVAPCSKLGKISRLPFIKFLCHCASDFMFIVTLVLASQQMESFKERKDLRAPPPTQVEIAILIYVAGYIWAEIKQLWDKGVHEYSKDWWNLLDFVINCMYIATIGLRATAYVQVHIYEMGPAKLQRDRWHAWDPTLVAEAVFAVANIFSSLRMFYLFTANAQLGPLQISLGRMVEDICKFLCVMSLVLASFAVGLNQLYYYYNTVDKDTCSGVTCNEQNNAYSTLFNAVETLIWTVFGLVDLSNTQVQADHTFTEWIGAVMMACYCVTSIIVLVNMLIAMMNSSFQKIQNKADMEWKFARSRLWMSYFDEGGTLPVPFNIIPTPKSIYRIMQWMKRTCCSRVDRLQRSETKTSRPENKRIHTERQQRDKEYQEVMRKLSKRYIANMKREDKADGVSEDDLNEIKQDISAFRYEMLSLLGQRYTSPPTTGNKTNNTATQQQNSPNGLPPHLQPGFGGFGSGRKGKKYQYQPQTDIKRIKIEPIQEETYAMPEFLKVKSVKNAISAVNEFRRQSVISLKSRARAGSASSVSSTTSGTSENNCSPKTPSSCLWHGSTRRALSSKPLLEELELEEEEENLCSLEPDVSNENEHKRMKAFATGVIEADIPPRPRSPGNSVDDSQSTSGVASQNASFQSQDSNEEQEEGIISSFPPPAPEAVPFAFPPRSQENTHDRQEIASISGDVQRRENTHSEGTDEHTDIPMMKMPAKRTSFLWGGRTANGEDVTTRYMYNGRMPNTNL